MLKIRLTRVGKKNKAYFRIVVCDHTCPVKGKFIEILGSYNPHQEKKVILKKNRVKFWLSKGAKLSKSLESLISGQL
jgi:small subunit ribosomal protein S16